MIGFLDNPSGYPDEWERKEEVALLRDKEKLSREERLLNMPTWEFLYELEQQPVSVVNDPDGAEIVEKVRKAISLMAESFADNAIKEL